MWELQSTRSIGADCIRVHYNPRLKSIRASRTLPDPHRRRKREQEMEQEAFRTARGGRPAGSRARVAWNAGASPQGVAPGAGMGRRRRDFLGYYSAMGLQEAGRCGGAGGRGPVLRL